MNAPAAISATFADFKLIKGRKCCQLVFEVPIEQADLALHALGGLPNPASEAWCALARLDLSNAKADTSEKQKRSFAELQIAHQAALLCQREAFWRFLKEVKGFAAIYDVNEAARALRSLCHIASRSELSTNVRAAGIFQTITHEFEDWLRQPL